MPQKRQASMFLNINDVHDALGKKHDDDLICEGASKGIVYSSRAVGIVDVVAFTPSGKSYILGLFLSLF